MLFLRQADLENKKELARIKKTMGIILRDIDKIKIAAVERVSYTALDFKDLLPINNLDKMHQVEQTLRENPVLTEKLIAYLTNRRGKHRTTDAMSAVFRVVFTDRFAALFNFKEANEKMALSTTSFYELILQKMCENPGNDTGVSLSKATSAALERAKNRDRHREENVEPIA